MKNLLYPKKLQPGDEIRVIAPSRSLAIISDDVQKLATQRLTERGYKVTFGKNVRKCDDFLSSSVVDRLTDLHDAFKDPQVKAIFTVIGGFNCNQLLDGIDYELIASNPKILMGFSDITALSNAILAKTGLVTYSGPHYSSWGMLHGFEFTKQYFSLALEHEEPYSILTSKEWSDDPWFMDQEARAYEKNVACKTWSDGDATGRIIGCNLSTISLLLGTSYWPGMRNSILFIEDDEESSPEHFDRQLQALMHQRDFIEVKALLIGRFQRNSRMTDRLLGQIISSKSWPNKIPIISGLSFGHTTPIITLPIGGVAKVAISGKKYDITVTKH